MEVAAGVTALCNAPPEEDSSGAGQAVPQYTAALEAASSLGQTLRKHYIALAPEALDAVLGITAALSSAASGEAAGIEKVRAEGADKTFSDPKNTEEVKKNGAAIAPWIHAHIGLGRLGVGTDAFGVPLAEATMSFYIVIGCHFKFLLSFLRDLRTNLAVIAVIFSQNDSVTHG
jgi:hypothetical protein